MREKVRVLYYPDMDVSQTTLKKCILFFDELHFMDRPSFTIGNYGSIGAASPLRGVARSFREDAGIPFYVHVAPNGRVPDDLLNKINADLDDITFIENYILGLQNSHTFRQLNLPSGHYGSFGTDIDLLENIKNLDLSMLSSNGVATSVLEKKIDKFDKTNPEAVMWFLLSNISLFSAKLHNALQVSVTGGFIPIADAIPYSNLLNVQYVRASKKLEPLKNNIQVADLGFSIFDELISNECIQNLTMEEVVAYRKKSEKDRIDFLEYLSSIQAKYARVPANGDYQSEITRLINAELKPAAIMYKKKLETIGESFTGNLIKKAVSIIGGGSLIHLFTDLSWERIFALAGSVGPFVINSAIDNYLAERALKRECSISYILSLDDISKSR